MKESSAECEIIRKNNVNKVVFWLPYKILNQYKGTSFQKATEAKYDSDLLDETISGHIIYKAFEK
jgi:hypothetical protein